MAIKEIYSITAPHIVTHVVEKIVPLNPWARVAYFTDNRESSRKSCRIQSAGEFSELVSYVHSIMTIFKQNTPPSFDMPPSESSAYILCWLLPMYVDLSRRRSPHHPLARLSVRHMGGVDYFFRLRELWKVLVLVDLKHIDWEAPTTTSTESLVFPASVLTSE